MAEEMSTRGRGICAVCDKEAVYAGQLTEYFSAKGGLPFEVQAFSSTEPLEAYAREHPIDLLLISPDLLSEKLKQLKVKKIMLLSDGSQPKGENLPSTYKYQSSEGILREVLDCYGTVVEPERTSQVRMQRAQFLGVYSPVRRCGRTSFALMLGQVLAADSRVLYLNFEEYSGFRGLLACRIGISQNCCFIFCKGVPGYLESCGSWYSRWGGWTIFRRAPPIRISK